MIDLGKAGKQREFADIIGVSEAAVSGMVKAGLLIPKSTLGEWLKDYCAHLREQAAGRAAAGDLDLATERAGLARAQREKIEMQNAVTRGELAPVVLIEEVLTKAASRVAGIFDAIPGMVRRRVPKLEAEEIALIAGEVAKARNVVASMSLANLNDATEAGSEDADPSEIA